MGRSFVCCRITLHYTGQAGAKINAPGMTAAPEKPRNPAVRLIWCQDRGSVPVFQWRTILHDGPVQHVGDFRTDNLAEVLAQLVTSGHQVFVAVENEALAELLARCMPVTTPGEALRPTFGLDDGRSSALFARRDLVPMASSVLAA